MKKLFLFIFLFLGIIDIYAQGNKEGLPESEFLKSKQLENKNLQGSVGKQTGTDNPFGKKKNPENYKKNNYINPFMAKRSGSAVEGKPVTADSAYYSRFVKRHGWFEGHGRELSFADASKLNCYYKFSRKNSAGHWTLIQAFNGNGNLTANHGISPYILNQNDDNDTGVNKEWKEKIQSMCQIELIGSADGKEVIQERSLDAYGNVVFISIPTKIGIDTYLYTYIDAWGRPAYLRTDSLGNDIGFANFVEVTRDKKGFETLFKYTDRNGVPQKNSDGAFMKRIVYDFDGNESKTMSLNVLGKCMIDDFGNCGMEYTYDSYGNMLTAMSHNANWEPMLHPVNNRSSLSDETCGYWFEYDDWGREIERGFLDTLGHKCCNQFGTYRVSREYDNHGLQTHCVAYDVNGQKCAMDSLGIAEYINETNDNGYYLSTQTLDSVGNLVNNAEGFCKKTWIFNNDEELEETEYFTQGDSVLMKFHYEKDLHGNEFRQWFDDDLIRVDSVNERGDNILVAYYTLSYKPKDLWGFHKRISTYKYEDKKRILTQIWIDQEGRPADEENSEGLTNGYTRSVVVSDSIAHSETKYQYYYDYLKQAFVQDYDDNMVTVKGQYDITPSGEHARVGWWDVLHYNAKVELDYNSKIKSFIVENEFGEPSYLSSTNNNLTYHYQVKNSKGDYIHFDEDGVEIPDSTMKAFRENLPKAFCIEVTDTLLAKSNGIKNGDVIVAYGDWTCDVSLKNNINDFYVEAIMQAAKNKTVSLLRHHPETSSSEIVHFVLPDGKTSDLGFYPHKIYYTQKEKERLLSTCKTYGLNLQEDKERKDTTILMAIMTKGGLFESIGYYLPMYDMKDPAILLYAKELHKYGRDTWSILKDSIETWGKKNMFNPSFAGQTDLVMTQDLKMLKTINKESKGNKGIQILPVRVSDACYKKIIQFYLDNYDNIPCETDTVIKRKSMPIIHVEDDGHFRSQKLEGYFVLLQFNHWRLGQDYDLLSKEIENSRDNEHSIAFIRINTDDILTLGEFYNMKFPSGVLGIRFQDYDMQEDIYQDALKQLKKIKKYK